MKTTLPFYAQVLRRELLVRQKKNPNYSLRAFAKKLEISSGGLSRILNNKFVPSFRLAQLFINELRISDSENELFMISLMESHLRCLSQKMMNSDQNHSQAIVYILARDSFDFLNDKFKNVLEIIGKQDLNSDCYISVNLFQIPSKNKLVGVE